MRKFSIPAAALLAGLCGAWAGCGGPAKPPAVAATGTVTFKKRSPAAGALVVFHPADAAYETRIGGKPFATVREDGRFTLTTFTEGDGAPEGDYGVTVQWQAKPKAGKLSLSGEGGGVGASMIDQGKYGDPRQPFQKVTVKRGGTNEFAFDVD